MGDEKERPDLPEEWRYSDQPPPPRPPPLPKKRDRTKWLREFRPLEGEDFWEWVRRQVVRNPLVTVPVVLFIAATPMYCYFWQFESWPRWFKLFSNAWLVFREATRAYPCGSEQGIHIPWLMLLGLLPLLVAVLRFKKPTRQQVIRVALIILLSILMGACVAQYLGIPISIVVHAVSEALYNVFWPCPA